MPYIVSSVTSPNGVRAGLEPIPWSSYFEQELYLPSSSPAEEAIHHVYITPSIGKGPLFVTHHGAGSSGLSFALFAAEIRKLLPDAGILSIDARGHGDTSIKQLEPLAPSLDLSLDTLSNDLVRIVQLVKRKLDWDRLPPLVLIGHSLGGAVVTDVAKAGKLGNDVLGYAVLDVVEGSAMDALQSMQTYLSTRPSTFPSLSAGIDWQ
jgi:protein phosphatase methylesterase 1